MKLPEILAVHLESACVCRIDMRIQPELEYFSGHFPEMPVLPGVVQLHWAVMYARQHTQAKGIFLGMENIKFLAVVLPETALCLTLNWLPQKKTLFFDYTAGSKKYSAGGILLSDLA